MFGKNPIRAPKPGDGTTLDVQEIFPTFQGEGPHAGVPAVFLRLGGCNLACTFCDTEFEDFQERKLEDIISEIMGFAADETGTRLRHLVVITGGEPLRQNITPLCEKLLESGFTVQLESNGTLYRPLPEDVQIVCSPKNSGTGYHAIRPDVLRQTIALKFIISTTLPGYHAVAEVGQTAHAIPVYVQPMDEYDETKNAANMAYARDLALKHGYRLSLQTHKIAGVR